MKNSGNSNKGPLSIDDFSEHFKAVYSENSNFSQDFVEEFVKKGMINANISSEESNHLHYDTSLLDSIITCTEVKKAVSELKRNKSPGYDLLQPELFLTHLSLYVICCANF